MALALGILSLLATMIAATFMRWKAENLLSEEELARATEGKCMGERGCLPATFLISPGFAFVMMVRVDRDPQYFQIGYLAAVLVFGAVVEAQRCRDMRQLNLSKEFRRLIALSKMSLWAGYGMLGMCWLAQLCE